MPWHYLYDNTSGKLLSEADQLPPSGTYRTRATRFDPSAEIWDETLKDFGPRPAPQINPIITKAQAKTALKNLLETNPSTPWTQLQRDQASYLLLLGLFRDFQNGGVY